MPAFTHSNPFRNLAHGMVQESAKSSRFPLSSFLRFKHAGNELATESQRQ